MCAKYYELRYILKVVSFDSASKFALFSVCGLNAEKLTKSKPINMKLKHENSIFRVFSNISANSHQNRFL